MLPQAKQLEHATNFSYSLDKDKWGLLYSPVLISFPSPDWDLFFLTLFGCTCPFQVFWYSPKFHHGWSYKLFITGFSFEVTSQLGLFHTTIQTSSFWTRIFIWLNCEKGINLSIPRPLSATSFTRKENFYLITNANQQYR